MMTPIAVLFFYYVYDILDADAIILGVFGPPVYADAIIYSLRLWQGIWEVT
jgi:hypothetical protein